MHANIHVYKKIAHGFCKTWSSTLSKLYFLKGTDQKYYMKTRSINTWSNKLEKIHEQELNYSIPRSSSVTLTFQPPSSSPWPSSSCVAPLVLIISSSAGWYHHHFLKILTHDLPEIQHVLGSFLVYWRHILLVTTSPQSANVVPIDQRLENQKISIDG
jgi:hypothetical protein